MSKTNGVANKKASKIVDPKKEYLSQADVPRYSLEEALRIPKAIVENYASGPVTPIQLASAMGLSPNSSGFRMLCGASIAFGLTDGGYNASEIRLLPIAKRILKPLEEGDDLAARREAYLKPKVIKQFMQKYNGNMVPRLDIACNILSSLNVPEDRVKGVFDLIINEGKKLGLITEIKDKQYVDLNGVNFIRKEVNEEDGLDDTGTLETHELIQPPHIVNTILKENGKTPNSSNDSMKKKRVYITHGKDMSFVDPIKKLLKFGEMEAVVSVEKQSVSKPVPDKVMAEMRSCGSAIIHVDAELNLFDKEAKEHVILNSNVLIEIGAAMALFGRRFILLVKKGITLPSNLQGLYEVRYEGDTLSGDVTIKLLEAINDMKNQPLPDEGAV